MDLRALPVPRGDLCPALDEHGVEQALGSQVSDTAHYGNGDEFEVTPGQVDVSHEFGCAFKASNGAVARVWVFARPVTGPEAQMIVRQERGVRDCTFPDPVGFGKPGLTSVCELPAKPAGASATVRARLEGLFTDTWLGCEVSEPGGRRDDVQQRAVSWCTEVVTTVGARP